jgi:three-Cys-motif partner protein
MSDDKPKKQPPLLDVGPPAKPELRIKRMRHPVWTENKAKLIERYLYYFVLVTKHGTYIDGFAGPQAPDKPDMWAAKLVLESQPRWLRHLYLFEQVVPKVRSLRELSDAQPARKKGEPKRVVHIKQGDFNSLVLDLLASGVVKQKEATFCLLDQRTFECTWATVKALAEYKTVGHKIELFYFLQNSWFRRADAALKDRARIEAWWGRKDWSRLSDATDDGRRDAFVARFKDELGYESVMPWPIYERRGGGRIMYYMIHATDHPAAPGLMSRSYGRAVLPKEPLAEQLRLELGLPAKA